LTPRQNVNRARSSASRFALRIWPTLCPARRKGAVSGEPFADFADAVDLQIFDGIVNGDATDSLRAEIVYRSRRDEG
jgi:hypothetical protein